MITDKQTLREVVLREVANAEIIDIHTHLYPSSFRGLLLWGIDELLTYHYLIAEYFRYSNLPYQQFFALNKREQADLIWQTLFIDHSPVSEAQRGVLTVLSKLGLDVAARDLNSYRQYFANLRCDEYIDHVFSLVNIKNVVMTNDPFDPLEKPFWDTEGNADPRFKAALRLDPLLNDYPNAYKKLQDWGYQVSLTLDQRSLAEIRRFLADWIKRMDALYVSVSLPPDFTVPEDSLRSRLIEQCIIPICREFNVPFAMMIGVRRLVNAQLLMAGDSLGKASLDAVEYLCRTYPENKFMVTMLSRENQHELAITARKFRNLMVFGCWWYLNNPSIIEEIIRERMETLGLSFIPQHSDARVLDQLIYKWSHSRQIIAKVLIDKYSDLLDTNWSISETEIHRDVSDLFGANLWRFIGRSN